MIDTARQRRAQQVEAKYAADLRRLRQAKEDDLQELNERFKVLKNAYRMECMNIKEEYSMKRLETTTKIDHMKDQRTILLRRLQDTTDLEELSVGENELARITSQIETLRASRIRLDRQQHDAFADAENRFEQRCKDNQEERRAINKHYINEAEKLHEAYLQHVEQNRQQREAEEGGDAV